MSLKPGSEERASSVVFTPERRAALDGVRGIAIASVFSMHLFSKPIGGFIGVDIFFVLSGFLITTSLVEEYNAFGSISLRNFYCRRLLRLAPALVSLLLVIGLGSLFLPPSPRAQLLKECAVTLFYLSNWIKAFDVFNMTYLSHSWSLSIEEQYYLLWPISVIVLSRLPGHRRNRMIAVILLAAISTLHRWFLSHSEPSNIWLINSLDTRMDGLMAGSALALLYAREPASRLLTAWRRPGSEFVLDLTILGVLAGVLLRSDLRFLSFFRLPMALVILLSLLLILTAMERPRSLVGSLLQFKPLGYIGKISYGLYLWHWPVILFLHGRGLTGWSFYVASIIGSFAISMLSHRYLEAYFLSKQKLFRRH